jgi:hypothetical protein
MKPLNLLLSFCLWFVSMYGVYIIFTNHLDDSDLDSGLEDDENLKGMNYYGQSIYSVSYLIRTVNNSLWVHFIFTDLNCKIPNPG